MHVEEFLLRNGVPCQPTARYGFWGQVPLYGVPILNARGHVDFLLPIVPPNVPVQSFKTFYRFVAFDDLRIWPCGARAFVGMFRVIK